MLGTVTKYDRVAGYGFIVPDDNTLPDYFVCPSFIVSESKRCRFLLPGWRVEFTPFDLDGKTQAHDVRIISKTVVIQRSAAAQVKP